MVHQTLLALVAAIAVVDARHAKESAPGSHHRQLAEQDAAPSDDSAKGQQEHLNVSRHGPAFPGVTSPNCVHPMAEAPRSPVRRSCVPSCRA